jgi:predicted transcriptional regulator
MTDGKQFISDELRQRVEELARQEQREPSELLEEAVNRYAAARRLERFSTKMGRRADGLGIREEDIPDLVQEVRRENQQRGR